MNQTISIADIEKAALELIIRCSCELPPDVLGALQNAGAREIPDSPAAMQLEAILHNAGLAMRQQQPLCQDTGVPHFYIEHPQQLSVLEIQHALEKSVAKATKRGFLRPNAVDPLTEKNSGDNLGRAFPQFNFEEHDHPFLRIRCLLKGGGSENVSAQSGLPDADLHAGRDFSGVAACVSDTVFRAQGKGCAPGIIGIGIGGDRVSGMKAAKEQLFRNLEDTNPDSQLMALEEELYKKLNQLGIGPMGLGGKTTVLGVKAVALHRLPACYFVSIAYMCWACRRAEIRIGNPE
ncbi:MAG: fumarate hydratase [Candidatus Neomarinimicrobiota bacterium]